MKEPYLSVTRCAYELCKRSDPITITPGHRRKLYHDDACRQAQHRLLVARKLFEDLSQDWAGFSPATRAALEELLDQHGEGWVRRMIAAVHAERNQASQPSLSEDEQAALRERWADLQPSTRNILEGLLTRRYDAQRILTLVTLAIGEERTHALCTSELVQRHAYLEIKLAEYCSIIDPSDRATIERQFMAVGQLLTGESCYFISKYRSLRIALIQQHLDEVGPYRGDPAFTLQSMDDQGYATFANGSRSFMDTDAINEVWASIVGKRGQQP